MQQQEDPREGMKRGFNVAFNLGVAYQRAMVVPLRNRFGVEALGAPCLFALILMAGWAGLSGDVYMWAYTAIWLMFFVHRRAQSVKLSRTERIHSQYDGWPVDAARLCKDERKAKLIVEPVMAGFAGAFAFWLYQQNGWDVRGLPYFLIGGAAMMVFVEMTKQAAWQRKIRGLDDARIEQEQMVNEVRDKWGDS